MIKGVVAVLNIDEIRSKIRPICQKYDIKSAYLFGSYARNEATESSDVDLRIDDGGSEKLRGLIQVSGMQIELEDALNKRVDLITILPQDDLNAFFREQVLADEVIVYGD